MKKRSEVAIESWRS